MIKKIERLDTFHIGAISIKRRSNFIPFTQIILLIALLETNSTMYTNLAVQPPLKHIVCIATLVTGDIGFMDDKK